MRRFPGLGDIRLKKYNYTDSKRGSIIVEAAVFLPVFLIAVITLSLLIRQVGFDETVFHTLLNQTRLLSVTDCIDRSVDDLQLTSLSSLSIGAGRREQYRAEIWKQLRDEIKFPVSLIYFGYDYSDGGHDHLIDAVIHYRVTVPIPRIMRAEPASRRKLVVRAFVGKTAADEMMTAEEMESEKESCIVYVFPHSGKRYHSASCSVVSAQPVFVILNNQIKKKFKPCEICNASGLSNGCGVYCFQDYGDAYHRGNCAVIRKYTVQIEKEEAVRKGYTPCSKCGGGAGGGI